MPSSTMTRNSAKSKLSFKKKDTEYRFSVTENGPGIDEAYKGKGIKLRQALGKTNRLGKTGTGLGKVHLHVPINSVLAHDVSA